MVSKTDSSAIALAFIGGGNRSLKYLRYVIDNPHDAVAVALVEPNECRRENFARQGGIALENCYDNIDDFFKGQRKADAVVICSPDVTHYQYAMDALRRGYHVLLEKPIAATMDECREIADLARELGLIVSVCHILRYHPYFSKIKEIIDSGELGEVVSITHSEAVGLDRSCHSYVRGAWRRDDIATPMILTKFCHDTDLMAWWAGAPMKRIHSFGSLGWFKEANAPEGSAARCIDCKVEEHCPYSAVELYSNRREWIANFDRKEGESIETVIDRELRDGQYGRCVFHCDNNVVDRQSIIMEMENGVTINMSMDLFTRDDNRTTHVGLTHGEIRGDERTIETIKFRGGERKTYDYSSLRGQIYHGGADHRIVADFIKAINGSEPDYKPVAHIDDILESHRICFNADTSRN